MKKLGRPKIKNNTKKKYIIYVDSFVYDYFKLKGNGSVSRGMKKLFEAIQNINN